MKNSVWLLGIIPVAMVMGAACSDGVATVGDGAGGFGGFPEGGAGPGGAGAGGGGPGPLPAGRGIGESCDDEDNFCRDGLFCNDDEVCEPNGDTEEGDPCLLSVECAEDLQCVNRECTPAGEGGPGDPCQNDAGCQTGLRCTLVGFGAQCLPAGEVDIGGDCDTSSDCYTGLTCARGTCAPPPVGVPPFGVPSFEGVECEEDDPPGDVRAHFEVPGADGADEADFFRLPFPNDIRLTSAGIDLEGFPTPGSGLLGFDPVKLYVDAVSELDGFSTYPTVYFRFSGNVDFASFRGSEDVQPVRFIDVTPDAPEFGSGRGLSWNISSGKTKYMCQNWMALRTAAGSVLLPGHTYAVILTTDGTDNEGNPIQRSENFEAMLEDGAPSDDVLADAHAAYQPLRDYLTSEGIDPDIVLNAALFTTGTVRDIMAELSDAVEAAPAPTASDWVLCADGVESPCPQAEEDRACGAGGGGYDEYHALVELPIFQEGDPPYFLPADGGGIDTSEPVRTEQVCMALTVPSGAMPAEGWPLVVYAHGTGGSFRSHVIDTVAGALSNAAVPGGSVGFAVLGIDQPQHGPRRGDSSESPDNLFYNFVNPDVARGNPLQGAADQLALARFAAGLNLTAEESGGDAIAVNAEAIVFFGHSQGATHGSLMLPYGDRYKAAVLSGNGASLKDALISKTSPVNIAAALPVVLEDFTPEGQLAQGVLHPVLALLQHWIDPADPLNFARPAGYEPVAGHLPKHVFQTYGIGDSFSPVATLEAYALAARLTQAAADGSVGTPDEIGNLDETPVPIAGNVNVGDAMVTLVVRQYAPPDDRDGHFVVFDVANANQDATRFLGMAAQGLVPQVGE